jgi:hypothetical protein
MKIRVTFSTVVEADDGTSRSDAWDVADAIADRIMNASGVVLEVYDVEPVEEWNV